LKLLVASSSPVAKPLITALIASNKHEFDGLITNPDKATGRGMQIEANELALWASLEKISISKPESNDDLKSLLLSAKTDLVITIAYGKLIPQDLLQLPKFGWINVHFSKLPKWRGAAPVQWAILSGDKTSGITVFQLDKGMDTGPTYLTHEIDINPMERSDELLDRLSVIGADLAIKTVDLISQNVPPSPQSDTDASLAPKFKKSDGKLDWSMQIDQILNQYRALAANPGVWTMLGDLRLKIDGLRISYGMEKIAPCSVAIEGEKLFIGAANGVIEIEKLTPAGRNQMSAGEFIRGLTNREGLSVG
jgi:methionyl-tRNA formyltransferase